MSSTRGATRLSVRVIRSSATVSAATHTKEQQRPERQKGEQFRGDQGARRDEASATSCDRAKQRRRRAVDPCHPAQCAGRALDARPSKRERNDVHDWAPCGEGSSCSTTGSFTCGCSTFSECLLLEVHKTIPMKKSWIGVRSHSGVGASPRNGTSLSAA